MTNKKATEMEDRVLEKFFKAAPDRVSAVIREAVKTGCDAAAILDFIDLEIDSLEFGSEDKREGLRQFSYVIAGILRRRRDGEVNPLVTVREGGGENGD